MQQYIWNIFKFMHIGMFEQEVIIVMCQWLVSN